MRIGFGSAALPMAIPSVMARFSGSTPSAQIIAVVGSLGAPSERFSRASDQGGLSWLKDVVGAVRTLA